MKKTLALIMALIVILSSLTIFGIAETSAASYPKIPALQISRVRQPSNDDIGLCYWASLATVQGYCLGTYTYGGVTTNYRKAGTDYVYTDRADAITKLFKDKANGYAHDTYNLQTMCPVKMTLVTKDIGKNAYTYNLIYQQLSQGKPVIIYTGTHASVIIGYNGSSTTLDPAGFTVMEIKRDGNWWKNSANYYNKYANKPQKDTNKGTDPGCYVTLSSWIEYCGNKVQEICYPTSSVKTDYTFAFSPNGGTGSMASITTAMGKNVVFPNCTFTYEGYVCAGYTAQRKSDGKWHVAGTGWRSNTEILNNNLQKSVYAQGLSFSMNESWTKEGGIAGDTFTLYPVWKPLKTTVDFYGNYSGSNYMLAINEDTYHMNYQSRKTDVYTVECENDTLKITGVAPGSTSADLLFKTQTNKSPNYNFNIGDNKEMVLTFKAKSTVTDTNFFFRWGYTSDTTPVALTTDWQEYTIDMSKQPNDGAHMHPFFDKAATVFIKDIALTDKDAPITAGETADIIFNQTYTVGATYANLPVPGREGYSFAGWYTDKFGGTQITETTPVSDGHIALYARWEVMPEDNLVLMGDTDLSGKINVKDATLIQKAVSEIEIISAEQTFAGNVLTADTLNVRDATAIQKWCAGMDTGAAVINEYISYI